MKHLLQHRSLWLLLALYLAAAVWMAFRLPANAAPNELLNYEYISVMRQTGRLPDRGAVDKERRYNEWHQPPVYYLWATFVGLPWPAPARVADPTPSNFYPNDPDATYDPNADVPPPLDVVENRFFTATHRGNLNPILGYTPQDAPLLYAARVAAALMGVAALTGFYFALKEVVSAETALFIISFTAFQPTFLHLSAAVNSDMPLTAISAATLACGLWLLRRPRPLWGYTALGLLVSLAWLTKANGAFLLAVLPVVLWKKWRLSDVKNTFYALTAFMGGVAPLTVAWMVRNARLTSDALGVSGSLPVKDTLLQNPLNFRYLVRWLPRMWRSFWLDWSVGDIGYAPNWVYWLSFGLVALALLGLLRKRAERPVARFHWLFLLAGGGAAYLYFAVKALTLANAGWMVPEGRWALPVLPSLAWFVGVGTANWMPDSARPRLMRLLAGLPPLLSIGLLLGWLPSIYPEAKQLDADWVPMADFVPVDIVYDDRLALRGVRPTAFTLGEESEVQMVWQALQAPTQDYALSLQLLVPTTGAWLKLDEQNTYHSLGLNRSSEWRANEVWQDKVTFIPQGHLNGPTRAWLWVAVEGVDTVVAGDAAGLPIALEMVVVSAETLSITAPPLPDSVHFGDHIDLVAVEQHNESVTLWWRANGEISVDYTLFIHVLDADGEIITQSDAQPNAGLSPTTIWRTGDVIRDTHTFAQPLPPNAVLRIGVYNPTDGVRLPTTQGDTRLPDDVVIIKH